MSQTLILWQMPVENSHQFSGVTRTMYILLYNNDILIVKEIIIDVMR